MNIGVPRETHDNEHRVGLTRFGVMRLVKQGHTVLVEKQAGEAAHFTDQSYERAGAQIVYSTDEVYMRSDMVCRVGGLRRQELDRLRADSVICAFQHLAVAPKEVVQRLMELRATVIGYEVIQDSHGDLPVLRPLSEMAGQMAIHIAAQYLQAESGGRGVLMGNVAGVPPPTILVLGAGGVGRAAARQALAIGAHVIVIDHDLAKLQLVHRHLPSQIVTALPVAERLEYYTSIADVIVGAILIPGARAPFLVTKEMVKGMKRGAVIIDISIDQGGCVETSRPTLLSSPTFVEHGVVHYCVPNLTANIPRTASRGLANAAVPYLIALADKGAARALRDDPGLAAGVYLWRGQMVNQKVAETQGVPAASLQELLAADEER